MSVAVKVLVAKHYYYRHYYTSTKSKGRSRDVVSSTRGQRISVASAKRRLTKTGRLNNTFITFWEAGGQVHVKSITSKVSSAQLISPHARHTLLEIYAEDVLILLVLPFSQAHKQSRRITGSATKQTTPPPSPIKQNNKLTACQNNLSTFVWVRFWVHAVWYLVPFLSVHENSQFVCFRWTKYHYQGI